MKEYNSGINKITTLFLGLWSIVTIVAAQQPADSLIQVTDLTHVKSITDLQVKPDGGALAYAVRSVVTDSTKKGGYTYQTQWFVGTAEKATTSKPLADSLHFSKIYYGPDGRRWAIGRGDNKRAQLFSFPEDGSKPVQRTALKYGVGQLRFSPDGTKVLLSTSLSLPELVGDSIFNPRAILPDWSFEKPGDLGNRSLRANQATADANGTRAAQQAFLLRNEVAQIAKVTDKLQFQTENATTGELRFTHWYVLELDSDRPAFAVSKGFRNHASADFMGKDNVLLNVESENGQHPDRVHSTDIVLLNLQNLQQRSVLGDAVHRFQVAAVSTTGRWVAISKILQNSLTLGTLSVYDTQNWTEKVIAFDRNQTNVQFAENEKTLYFVSPSNGGRTLNQVDLKTLKTSTLNSVDEGIGDYWIGAGKAIFTKTTFANPAELFVARADLKQQQQISDLHSSWLAGKHIGIPEKAVFQNDKGLGVEYWLLKPVHYTEGQKYPLVVEIHGGPASMFGPADASMWHEYQYFRSRGYAVLFANPRGSSGYGEDFLKANFNDWGPGPASDVLTAVDRSARSGWIDTTQLYVTGGSYGAYLTTWILAHDQRFRAASSQRGVYDLYIFFGSGNVWPMLKRYFGGFPWEAGITAKLLQQSPTTYAAQIKTPLLIFHGEQDNRTGPVQSDYLYKQLKVLERPVEYVRHPGADHEITRSGDPAQRIDQLLRTFEFFERFRAAN